MKRYRHTVELIIRHLMANDLIVLVAELTRQNGLSGQPLSHWKAKYNEMEVSKANVYTNWRQRTLG